MLLELPHTLQMVNRNSLFFLDSNVHTVIYMKLGTYELYKPNEKEPCKNLSSFVLETSGGL